MTEPWAAFGPMDEVPGLPSVMVGAIARAEAREQRQEARQEAERQAEREDRAEARLHHWMVQRAQQLALEGRPFDLNNPTTLVMSPEEQADRVFAAEDRAAARAEFRAKVDAGLLHVLNVPASEMVPADPEPEPPTPVEAARHREAGYVRLRVRRFFRDLQDAKDHHSEKART